MKSKRKNKKQILLSIAALFVVALVATGITYSWIEGGTTYSIQTEKDGDVKTGTLPNQTVFKSVTLDPTKTSQSLSLNSFDKTTNASDNTLIFSEASSADGENFYFPTATDGDGNPTAFRQANTNDLGTKYINYSFDVTAARKCYLAFDGVPTFTVTKDGQTVTDTSAFRIMLKSGDEKKILKTGSAVTENVVNSANGTTTSVNVESVNDYLYNSANLTTGHLFNYAKNATGTVEVSIWLDGESATSNLLGSEVTVDMNLKVAQEVYTSKIYVEPRAYSAYYGYTFNDSNDEFLLGAWHGTSMTADSDTSYLYTNDIISDDTYNFIVNDNNTTQYPVSGSGIRLKVDVNSAPNMGSKFVYILRANNTWEKFDDTKVTTTVNATAFDNDGTAQASATNAGTVSIDSSTPATTTSKTVYYDKGTTTLSLSAAAKTHYTFAGWYENENCTGTAVSSDANYTYTVDSKTAKTFYAKFVEDPKYNITFNASTFNNTDEQVANGFTGGSVTVGGTNYTASHSVSIYLNDPVSATATANTNYTFEGWYTDSACTQSVGATLNTTATSDVTYYAKFREKNKYNITIGSSYQNSAGQITANNTTGGNVQVGGSNITVPQVYNIYDGESVSATAVAKTHCTLQGWYSDAACTTRVSANTVYTATANGANATYYALFQQDPVYTVNAVISTVPTSEVGGTVSINGGGASFTDYKDTSITLMATPSAGYRFDGWYSTSALITKVTDSETYATKIDGPRSYYAKFVKTNTINLTAVTDGAVGGAGGTVSLGTGTAGATASSNVDTGSSVAMTATANYGYAFQGFYTQATGGSLITTVNPYNVQVNSNLTYYARFVTNIKTTTIYFESRSYSTFNVYVYDADDESIKYTTNKEWPGDVATLDAATGYYKYTFDTSDIGNFRVIVSNGGSVTEQWPATQTPGLQGVIGETYLFPAGSPTALTSPFGASTTATLPSNSRLSNTLVFDLGASNTTQGIWYWNGSSTGQTKSVVTHAGTSKTVSTFALPSGNTQPNAIAFNRTLTANQSTWPGDTGKITGDIKYSSAQTDGVYYVNSTASIDWSAFTHITPTATVSATSAEVDGLIKISASATGTLSSSSNNKYSYYVSNGTNTYRIGSADTTAKSILWQPETAGTWNVYVVAKDQYGIETVVSSAKTVTVN